MTLCWSLLIYAYSKCKVGNDMLMIFLFSNQQELFISFDVDGFVQISTTQFF